MFPTGTNEIVVGVKRILNLFLLQESNLFQSCSGPVIITNILALQLQNIKENCFYTLLTLWLYMVQKKQKKKSFHVGRTCFALI